MLCSRLGSKREGKKEKNGKVFKWSSIHYVFWAFESAKWRAHSSWWKNRHRICNSKKKDEREKFEWKILRETEKKLKTDEMKANDNRFLACIHIHCSNVERESVEISEHQPINMAWALIFSLGNWVCVCVRVVFGISIDYSMCTAKRLLSLRLQELFHSLLLFPQRYRRQTTHRTY